MIRTRLQGDVPFFPNMLNNGNVEVCLKEDVDKVIAEKDDEIAELKMKLARAQLVLQLNEPEALFSNLETMGRLRHKIDVVERRELHQKYKRCLAMAKWCLREYLNCDKYKITFWLKWHNRWLKLAEKFKEAK